MTWTYDGNPDAGSTATADERRDAVRLILGDTDAADEQVTDEEIAFALDEESNNVYTAAILLCNSLVAKYARLVNLKFSDVSVNYEAKHKNYVALANRLRNQAAARGLNIGDPKAGGIKESIMDSVEEDSDRVEPIFRRRQFRNPPEDDVEDANDYLQ